MGGRAAAWLKFHMTPTPVGPSPRTTMFVVSVTPKKHATLKNSYNFFCEYGLERVDAEVTGRYDSKRPVQG